jgi:hypothetical protein
MTRSEQIREEMLALDDEGAELAQEFQKNETLPEFAFRYQDWYTKALNVVKTLAPDRIAEFRGYYEPDTSRKTLSLVAYTIQDYLKGAIPWEIFDVHKQAMTCFFNQRTIFRAVLHRVESILSDIASALYADLEDNEIEVSKRLAKINLRAAGALLGVIIEGHLQKVAASHAVTIAKKNPTIADLNDPLKTASVIDLPTWRKITYLGDLRNLCSHKKDREPTETDVEELIKGAEWVSKNIA